jgi:hypothetical protein
MMEFWLNSNLIPIVVLREILYLQNIMLKNQSRFNIVLED